MNKVTPKQGQVWECIKPMMHFNIGDELNLGGGISIAHTWLQEHFKFKPQSDLERLAVRLKVWPRSADEALRSLSETVFYWRGDFILASNGVKIFRTQHQNMRYDLGLDEKLKPTKQDIQDFMDGATKILKHYKDTKMIDLSPFKIGDKLITRDSDRVKVVFLSESQMITEDEDGSGCLNMYKLDGTCIDRNAAGNFCSISDIVSRYDPRHWLSQLPDAGLFNENYLWLSCDKDGDWWAAVGEPELLSRDYEAKGQEPIVIIKMPKLTGGEWKLSKISIVDLKAWQVANKRAQGGPIKPGTAYIVGERGGPDVPVPAGPIVEANPQ